MENKNFRSRLRNHTTEVNADAWQQMSEMLDTMPPVIEEMKKKKKRGWWFLLFLAAGLITMTFLWKSSLGDEMISESTNSENTKTTQNKKADQSNLSSDNETINQETIESKDSQINKPEKNQVRTNNNISNNNTTNSEGDDVNSLSQNDINKKTSKETSSSIKSLLDQNVKGRDATDKSAVTSSRSETNQSQSYAVSDKLNKAGIIDSNTSKIIDEFNDNGLRVDFEPMTILPGLALSAINSSLKKTLFNINDSDMIFLPKNRNLYWFGSAGISDINGARGQYIGSGFLLDMDKVASFELDWTFLRVEDKRYIFDNSLWGSDIETAITLWLHLNIIRSGSHKLSLEFGPSIYYHWNTSKMFIGGSSSLSPNSGFNPNFRGGTSYTYFITEQSGIGLKLSFSLFDSGYFAFKYYKRI